MGGSTLTAGAVLPFDQMTLDARVTPEAQAIAQVDNAISAANVPEVRADLDSPLSLMLGECQAPGVLDGLDHVPLTVSSECAQKRAQYRTRSPERAAGALKARLAG